MTTIKSKNLLKRCIMLIFGLFIMAYGVSFSIKAGLGTSPISSLPYTVSELVPLTVGTATIFLHCILIILQILILRKKYNPVQLLQLPIALIFGYLTDFTLMTMENVNPGNYIEQWVLCLLGVLLVAIGVSCEVNANVIPLAGEGFTLAVCKAFSFQFPIIKVCFDCTLVAASCIIGFICQGKLIGVREGTVAAALLVGLVSKQITKYIIEPLIKRLWS